MILKTILFTALCLYLVAAQQPGLNLKEMMLKQHNEARRKIKNGEVPGQPAAKNMPDLQWDDGLAEKAKVWAEKCVRGHDDGKERATARFPDVGQNWAGHFIIDHMFKEWFEEYKFYDYKNNKCSRVCGHYTQIVWSTTTHVGCAVARCSGKLHYPYLLVCNYGPGGNVGRKQPDGTIKVGLPYEATETPIKPPGGSEEDKALEKKLLQQHNDARRKIKSGSITGQPAATFMPDLQWDDGLAKKAKHWAEQCKVGHDENSDRVTDKFFKVGQNWAGGSRVEDLVGLWFEEYKFYDYHKNTCSRVCGHYTQVVWADTTHVGCGWANCEGKLPYQKVLVCNYGPAGNIGRVHPDGTLKVGVPYQKVVTSTEQSTGAGEDSMEMKLLRKHNELRRQVKNGAVPGQPPAAILPDLQWDNDLAKLSEAWANECSASYFRYSPQKINKFKNVGQNGGAGNSIDAIVNQWFDEHKYYDYNNNLCKRPSCSRYTQLVWDTTTHVGCALGKCAGKSRFRNVLVCSYGPAGNVLAKQPDFSMKIRAPYYKVGTTRPQDMRFEDKILRRHNEVRHWLTNCKVAGQPGAKNLKELQWDNDLAKKAQEFASKCSFVRQSREQRKTAKFDNVGQNVGGGCSPESVFDLWFYQYQGYNYMDNTCKYRSCSDYLQIIWANTTHVGCGQADCSKQLGIKSIVVCNYGPAGVINSLQSDGSWKVGLPYEKVDKCPSSSHGGK